KDEPSSAVTLSLSTHKTTGRVFSEFTGPYFLPGDWYCITNGTRPREDTTVFEVQISEAFCEMKVWTYAVRSSDLHDPRELRMWDGKEGSGNIFLKAL
ncbi:hypothetical protein STEG23_020847, partial [Scotinomys teguina]